MIGQSVVHSSDYPNYRTDRRLFEVLDQEFDFQIDFAADASNHLCPLWLGPDSPFPDEHGNPAVNALIVEWAQYAVRGFLNPPYSRKLRMPIDPWIAECHNEAQRGVTTVAVIPSRTDTKWWHQYVMLASEVRFIPHRVTFDMDPAALAAKNEARVAQGKQPLAKMAGAGFPSAVVVWRPEPRIRVASPRFVTWDYLPTR